MGLYAQPYIQSVPASQLYIQYFYWIYLSFRNKFFYDKARFVFQMSRCGVHA